MASDTSIQALKGIWDYVNGDNIDDYLIELGVGMMARMVARGLKPRLTISENEGKWSFRTETALKTMTIEFTPGIEFDEKTGDGRELKGVIRFEEGKWVQKMRDKNGKESVVLRWVDEKDQLQIISECGKAKVAKVYKRVQQS